MAKKLNKKYRKFHFKKQKNISDLRGFVNIVEESLRKKEQQFLRTRKKHKDLIRELKEIHEQQQRLKGMYHFLQNNQARKVWSKMDYTFKTSTHNKLSNSSKKNFQFRLLIKRQKTAKVLKPNLVNKKIQIKGKLLKMSVIGWKKKSWN